MGLVNLEFLDDEKAQNIFYACRICKTHLSLGSDIVSKNFTAASGRAYLFAKAYNIDKHSFPQDRVLRTGLHTVQDVKCIKCETVVGWTYLKAYEERERYKIGKYVLERSLLIHQSTQTTTTITHPDQLSQSFYIESGDVDDSGSDDDNETHQENHQSSINRQQSQIPSYSLRGLL